MTVGHSGEVVASPADDGFTSLSAAHKTLGRFDDPGAVVAAVLAQVERTAREAEDRTVQVRRWALPAAQPTVDPQAVADACAWWQSGRDGSSLLRGAARVLTGVPHYFTAEFITGYETAARDDEQALRAAAALFRRLWSTPPADAADWAASAGWEQPQFAGRGIRSGPQDRQIERAIATGVLAMPLWGVSLDPSVPATFGDRFVFQLEGPFPGVGAAAHSGIKAARSSAAAGSGSWAPTRTGTPRRPVGLRVTDW